ncbi:hypothetical protein PLICRDRAFT_38318 [Plicaturopsis crispa FD-325 SS-3]|nr:hypothetical protein PLICRDRAFT_38318 [Plicaturopsis crispa FD-325 SS-3]
MARKGAPSLPPSKGTFSPPNDAATYRDLLLFEERLKTNAASLQRRKSRYQLFLLQLLLVIAFLLSEVLLHTSFLAIPYAAFLRTVLPDIYAGPNAEEVRLHPYFASGLLFVAVTTLVLFFASGMYSEKIAYANQYVHHANRALRSFNMYLNVRKPPLRASFNIPLNPLSFFFPRPEPPPKPSRSRSPSPTAHSPAHTLAPLPPATHPRGELIFSSRVDRSFRDSYERYRTAFERRREERERAKTWYWWLREKLRFRSKDNGAEKKERPGDAPGGKEKGRQVSGSATGRGTSRRSSPVPASSQSLRSGSHASGSRGGTPSAVDMVRV